MEISQLIDINHMLFYMDAIRNSKDPKRTLESFWKGQIKSKIWLAKEVGRYISNNPASIDIYGGWTGVLASILFQQPYPIKSIRSIDIDPDCENISNTMNAIEYEQGRFKAITADMCNFRSDADIAINTSCEHITQDQYNDWLTCLPYNSLIVIQSNNYNIPEHVRIANNLTHFQQQSSLSKIFFSGELELPLYTRYMLIGQNGN